MTDDKSGSGDGKKRPDDGNEVDWDSALSDWETKTFVPEVAKDVMTDKPASLAGQTVSRPLYRPPVPSPKGKAPPPPAARPAPPRIGLLDDDDEDEQGATVISTIPRELLRRKEPPRPKPPVPGPPRPGGSRSGGLGQFFARDDRRDSGAPNDEAGSKSATRARGDLRDEGVPAAPPPKAERSGVGPLRRPLPGTAETPGEAFDPFAEPRPEQLTIPAESELAELLDAPAIEKPSPSLHSPDARQYDPEEETIVGRLDQLLPGGVVQATRPPPASRRATTPPPLPPSFPPSSGRRDDGAGLREVAADRRWDEERPAPTWLDESTKGAFRERAAWLEQEARALDDDASRGRALLTCSEILATAGDRDRAEALAKEARDLAPSLALAHRQVRGLIPPALDASELLDALDAEIGATPVGPARTHAVLLAADAAAADGDDGQAADRLDQVARTAPNDVRAAVGRAARA
ncbi:MAG TPA: hypothetical protein VH044_02510, partial [Polyangiaceae bacterium]|nr:hypothetical protein [Polyangiaceae bacterium]